MNLRLHTDVENGNLHRNVIFEGSKAPERPWTRIDSINPEDLWAWMDKLRDKGIDSIAMPHNSNGSNGQMFEVEQFDGSPIDKEYASLRMRNEPIVEMTQVKGTSDTHPLYRLMMSGQISVSWTQESEASLELTLFLRVVM